MVHVGSFYLLNLCLFLALLWFVTNWDFGFGRSMSGSDLAAFAKSVSDGGMYELKLCLRPQA